MWKREKSLLLVEYRIQLTMIQRRRLSNRDPTVRFGTKTLLAVRVVSKEETPAESLQSIEGAIFGTGSNPDSIPDNASVVAQYNAVTHGKLLYKPAEGLGINHGVTEISIESSFAGNDLQKTIIPEILSTTEAAIGPLSVVDRIIFCLPNDSLFGDDTDWTGFTFLYSPVSVRCGDVDVAR